MDGDLHGLIDVFVVGLFVVRNPELLGGMRFVGVMPTRVCPGSRAE